MHPTSVFHGWLTHQRVNLAATELPLPAVLPTDAFERRPVEGLLPSALLTPQEALGPLLRAKGPALVTAVFGAANIGISFGLFSAGVVSSSGAVCLFWVGIGLLVGAVFLGLCVGTRAVKPLMLPAAEVIHNKATQASLAEWVSRSYGKELAVRKRVASRILAACDNRSDGRLVVSRDLYLGGTGITKFPPGLTHFEASLLLINCTNFTSFDDDIESLSVGWNLSLSGCTKLARLPRRLKNLSVGNHLNFDWCLRFAGFSANLKSMTVNGYVMLSHCRDDIDVSAVNPNWRRDDGAPVVVEVSMSQLMGALGHRLRQQNPIAAHDPQFEFRLPEAINAERVELQRYLNFWHHWRIHGPYMTRAGRPRSVVREQYGPPLTEIQFADFQGSPLCRFLRRLMNTAEYSNMACRRRLSDFVVNLLHAMFEDASFYRICVDRMQDSFMSCSDATTLVKNDLEQMLMVRSALAVANDDAALRSLAKSLIKLQVVREHAAQRHERFHGDDVEIHLAYEIALTQRLGLPLTTTRARHTWRVNVPHEAIEQAYIAALAAEQDEARVNEFLRTWRHWRSDAATPA